MTKWTSIYQVDLEYRAEIVKDVLRDKGITAEIFRHKDSAYGFGHLEVQVPSDEVLLAIRIIEKEIKFE